MIDLTKASAPDYITVGGRTYKIKTWFKYWLRFLQICNNRKEVRDFDFLFLDEIPENKAEAFKSLAEFANPKSVLPRGTGSGSSAKVLDYTIDSNLIYSAFVQQYGIDLVTGNGIDGKPLHWHKFLALMEGIHDTKLSDVMDIRSYDETDKTTFEQSRKNARDAWSLDGIAEEDSEVLEEFNKKFS